MEQSRRSRWASSDPADVVRIDRRRPFLVGDGRPEAVVDQAHDAGVDLLARVVTHDEERRRIDPEARRELGAGAVRVSLLGFHHRVDALPQPTRLELLGRLRAFAAFPSVEQALLHHRDVHPTIPSKPRQAGAMEGAAPAAPPPWGRLAIAGTAPTERRPP